MKLSQHFKEHKNTHPFEFPLSSTTTLALVTTPYKEKCFWRSLALVWKDEYHITRSEFFNNIQRQGLLLAYFFFTDKRYTFFLGKEFPDGGRGLRPLPKTQCIKIKFQIKLTCRGSDPTKILCEYRVAFVTFPIGINRNRTAVISICDVTSPCVVAVVVCVCGVVFDVIPFDVAI